MIGLRDELDTDGLRREAADAWTVGRHLDALVPLLALNVRAPHPSVNLSLAFVYFRIGLDCEGLAELDRAAEASTQDASRLQPLFDASIGDPADCGLARGYLLIKEGELESAHERLKAAREIGPLRPIAHYCLGLLYVAAGDQAAARECYISLEQLDGELARQLYDKIICPDE